LSFPVSERILKVTAKPVQFIMKVWSNCGLCNCF